MIWKDDLFMDVYLTSGCSANFVIVQNRDDYSTNLDNLSRKIRNWQCQYCTSPNPPSNRHCSQCGAPKETR